MLLGGFGMIWFILWMIIVRDNPKTYPHISNDEKEYIVSTVGDMHELRKTREVRDNLIVIFVSI